MNPADVIIYYFNNPEIELKNDSNVIKIEILKDGRLSEDFGPGFFDEADNIAIDLYNLNRHSNN